MKLLDKEKENKNDMTSVIMPAVVRHLLASRYGWTYAAIDAMPLCQIHDAMLLSEPREMKKIGLRNSLRPRGI